MTIRFTARSVGVAEDDDYECLVATVAEYNDDGAMVLMFQCSLLEPDEQEIRIGDDSHCLVTADQGCAYGCVEEIVLRDQVLYVKVATDSLADLDLDDHEIEAVLDVPDDVITELRDTLRRIMAYGRPDARPSVIEL